MTMGKIRKLIAYFIGSKRINDKRHPRYLAGYLAGMHDAKLEAETTNEDGIIRLEKWSEGHVLWHHGEIVWRSWLREEVQNSSPAQRVPGNTCDEWAISQAQLHSACLSFRHDFGLLNESERATVMFEAREWLTAWRKALATTEGSAA